MAYFFSTTSLDDALKKNYLACEPSRWKWGRKEVVAMQAGDLLRAPYTLEEFVGRGGQGECWLVREEQEQWLAKLYPLHRQGWEPYDLVEREATLLRQLEHPGIPAYRDMFLLPEGPTLCLVREWLPGQNLEQVVATRRFSEQEVRVIADQLLEILIYIHGLSPSLIHRDIKPSNIILRPDQSIALIDFGSVRDAIYEGERMSVMGTYGYTPPEQFLGHPTPASDLYALGATLVYLLSRQHPSTLPLSHNRLQFESYINVRPRFLRILQQLLTPAVEERCQSAEEAREALRRCDTQQLPATIKHPQESLEETLSRAASPVLQASQSTKSPDTWQRNRRGLLPWSWERQLPLHAAGAAIPDNTTHPTPAPGTPHPELRAVVQQLQERYGLTTLDAFCDPLELLNAIDDHFGPDDDEGRQLLLRLLHPYDAADLLFGFYSPDFLLERLSKPLMERFSLLFASGEDNAIKQWVLCYFLQKHGWIPQDNWRRKSQLSLPFTQEKPLGLPRRAARFFQRFHDLPTGKQAKQFSSLVAQWEQLGRHYHLCSTLRPDHLVILVTQGYYAFQRLALPTYPTERQEAWYRDRLLRWSLRSFTSWPPYWLGKMLRKDADKYHRLGAYIGIIFKEYARFDELRSRLQEEYHWLLAAEG